MVQMTTTLAGLAAKGSSSPSQATLRGSTQMAAHRRRVSLKGLCRWRSDRERSVFLHSRLSCTARVVETSCS